LRRLAPGAALALLVLSSAVPTRVAAHLGHVIMRAERYMKIDASPEETRVVVTLTLGAGESTRVLGAADANHDGDVSSEEGAAYLRQWGDGLRTDLPVTVDGEPVEVRWADPYLDPIGAVRPTPTTVEMVGHLVLEPGRHRLTITDKMRAEAVDRTDVAFRARDGVVLIASGVEPDVASRTPDLALGPARAGDAPRQLTAVLTMPGTPRSLRWLYAVGAVAALVLAAIAWIALRRRKGVPTKTGP